MYIPSFNMQLPIPVVGNAPGPEYAFDINTSLTLIDSHDHSPGKGVQITPAGMNISLPLPFHSNPATGLGYLTFTAQATTLTAPVQMVYSAPAGSPSINELYYTDSNGTTTQITKNGLVNAIASSIPGESYSAGTFFWVQGGGSTTPANFDIGSVTIRPNTAGTSFGVILGPPSAIASQYNLNFPLLPGSGVTSLVSLQNSGGTGVMGLANVDGTTLAFSAGTLSVTNGGITTTQIASSAGIVGTQLSATAGITATQLANAVNQTSTSAGSYSNSTTSFTTITSLAPALFNANRPYAVNFQGPAIILNDNGSGSTVTIQLEDINNSINIYTWTFALQASQIVVLPLSAFNSVVVSAFTNPTFALQAKVSSAAAATVTVSSGAKTTTRGW